MDDESSLFIELDDSSLPTPAAESRKENKKAVENIQRSSTGRELATKLDMPSSPDNEPATPSRDMNDNILSDELVASHDDDVYDQLLDLPINNIPNALEVLLDKPIKDVPTYLRQLAFPDQALDDTASLETITDMKVGIIELGMKTEYRISIVTEKKPAIEREKSNFASMEGLLQSVAADVTNECVFGDIDAVNTTVEVPLAQFIHSCTIQSIPHSLHKIVPHDASHVLISLISTMRPSMKNLSTSQKMPFAVLRRGAAQKQ
jgi:hypothetical protein